MIIFWGLFLAFIFTLIMEITAKEKCWNCGSTKITDWSSKRSVCEDCGEVQ